MDVILLHVFRTPWLVVMMGKKFFIIKWKEIEEFVFSTGMVEEEKFVPQHLGYIHIKNGMNSLKKHKHHDG
jgi:hypothetical protein